MSAPPYMKLYIADYHVETTELDVVGHGAYLLLLMAMWRAGGKLPRDDGKLCRLAKCSPEQWAAVRSDVMAHFKGCGGSIKHARVTKEIAKYQAVVDGSSAAGKASAAKRANKNNDAASTDVEANVQQKTNQPEPELNEEASASSSCDAPTKAKVRRKPEVTIPDGFPDAEALDDARNRAAAEGKDINATLEAERFRNHAFQVDRRTRDWRAAWRNWVITALEKLPCKPGSASSAPLASIAKFPNAAIRAYVADHKSEGWAVSFLDTCVFTEANGTRTIEAPNAFIAGKLKAEVPALEQRGIRIIIQPAESSNRSAA